VDFTTSSRIILTECRYDRQLPAT